MSATANSPPAWQRSTLAIALVGSLLMWAALPPLALGWLGWVAPVPWLVLVRMAELPGRRPYRALYFAGFTFWLAALHWLRLPHPAVIPLWFILAGYLAIYVPVFVALSRVAVHRLSVPLWLAAPTVWTGLELARAHLLTGFLMGSLAHTQVNWTALIQISDLVGEYGVDFVVMLAAACVATLLPISNERSRWRPLVVFPAALALSGSLLYGHWRLGDLQRNSVATSDRTGARIALIQGNCLADWKFDTGREHEIMDQYIRLSQQAVADARQKDGRPVDLVVWPETMFRTPIVTFDAEYQLPPSASHTKDEIASYGPSDLTALAARLGSAVLVGIDRAHYLAASSPDAEQPPPLRYNSAVLAGRDGKIVGTYDKMHLVMFGEYVPFAHFFPALNRLSSLTGSVEAGSEPTDLCTDGHCFVPNICYETVIPHVMRRQITTINRQGRHPDALVNVTNDAWYWGSSGLDMHLACGVFRAVETRTPLLIAANGGISAHVDRDGRILAQSPKQQPDIILADITPCAVQSWYMQYGDWFAGVCLFCCLALAMIGWHGRKRQ
jgi:apolipoprotein N-acyltransferase